MRASGDDLEVYSIYDTNYERGHFWTDTNTDTNSVLMTLT
jgi:hypothetical protein